jgi:hypothetical protein
MVSFVIFTASVRTILDLPLYINNVHLTEARYILMCANSLMANVISRNM